MIRQQQVVPSLPSAANILPQNRLHMLPLEEQDTACAVVPDQKERDNGLSWLGVSWEAVSRGQVGGVSSTFERLIIAVSCMADENLRTLCCQREVLAPHLGTKTQK